MASCPLRIRFHPQSKLPGGVEAGFPRQSQSTEDCGCPRSCTMPGTQLAEQEIAGTYFSASFSFLVYTYSVVVSVEAGRDRQAQYGLLACPAGLGPTFVARRSAGSARAHR